MGSGGSDFDDPKGLGHHKEDKRHDQEVGPLARIYGSSAVKGVVDRLFPRRGLPDLRERKQK